jgi:hypothetical protein
MYELMGVPGVC